MPQNWACGSTATQYLDGSTVTFADQNPITNSNVTNTAVSIQSGVHPASVRFTNVGAANGNGGVDYTISNANGGTVGISGSTGITLNGAGNVTLQSPNTFNGPVAINAGQLILQDGGALGSSSGVNVAPGAALTLQGVAIGNIPLTINVAGLALTPEGALNSSSGTNSYAGQITLAGNATINSGSSSTLTLTGGINNNGNLLTITGPGNTTVSNIGISGAKGLTYSGTGVLNLAIGSSYGSSGTTTVGSGTLQVTNTSGFATGVSSVAVSSGATLAGGGSSAPGLISGNVNIAGGATIAPSGGGVFTAAGSVGSLTVDALALNSGATSASQLNYQYDGSSFDSITVTNALTLPSFNGGTPVQFNFYSVGSTNNLTLASGASLTLMTFGSITPGYDLAALSVRSADLGGNQAVFSVVGNALDLNIVSGGASATWISTGPAATSTNSDYGNSANWSTGTIPSGAGLVATFGAGGQSTVSINSGYTLGQLNFNNGGNSNAPTSYLLTGNGSGSLTLNNSGNGASVNVSSGSLTPTLGANLTLTLADSSLTTTFNIASGSSLEVGGPINQTGGAQKVVLAGGGTLELASPNTYTGSTTINAGTLQINAGASIASTSVSIAAGGTLQLAGTTGALPSTANIATHGPGGPGDGALSGSSLGGSAAFAPAADFGGSPAAVPEPSTLLLAALGGMGIMLAFRRRT